MSVWAIVLCAGQSTRMAVGKNKTLLPLQDGLPAYIHCIRAFVPLTDGIVLVTGEAERALFRAGCRQYTPEACVIFAPGGQERQHSVYNGLLALPEDCDTVLIHDGARCFVTADVIENVLRGVREFGSGVAAIPARDTIKRVSDDDTVLETLPRSSLRIIQTPQGFRKKELLSAYEKAGDGIVTDDAGIMENAGYPVHLTHGSEKNIKLTYREDLDMLYTPQPRTGLGYDAHRLCEGRDLILCGVKIPWDRGLLGHSDADAALHALMDALLGAAALGDIGKWFPDSDEKYKGISSVLLLKEVCRLIREKGYEIVNCDITITAQKPKLAPYMQAMRETTAESMGIPADSVSVKATTTEHMGFEGRGEGISAIATASIIKTTNDMG